MSIAGVVVNGRVEFADLAKQVKQGIVPDGPVGNDRPLREREIGPQPEAVGEQMVVLARRAGAVAPDAVEQQHEAAMRRERQPPGEIEKPGRCAPANPVARAIEAWGEVAGGVAIEGAPLAALHRELAGNVPGQGFGSRRTGAELDRNVILLR